MISEVIQLEQFWEFMKQLKVLNTFQTTLNETIRTLFRDMSLIFDFCYIHC